MPCASAQGIFLRFEVAVRSNANAVALIVGAPSEGDAIGPVGPSALRVETHHVPDLSAAECWLDAAECNPDLFVIEQLRPGQYTSGALERLRARAPLARIWRRTGAWCDGEGRSGSPPVACASTPWHAWPARLEQELGQVSHGLAAAWSQPLTASADERWLAAAERPLPRGVGNVAIVARDRATAEALADVCRLGGYDVIVSPPVLPVPAADRGDPGALDAQLPCAVLWDTTADRLADATHLADFRRRFPQAPIVALVGFPRPADVRRARELGIAAVLARPYSIYDLVAALAHATKDRSEFSQPR
jgi:CheY-like chemotaxis protein